jgi:hypothetical protein
MTGERRECVTTPFTSVGTGLGSFLGSIEVVL